MVPTGNNFSPFLIFLMFSVLIFLASFLNRIIVFAKASKIDAKGETRLHVECRRGDLNKVRQLISEDVDINCQDHTGWTPLVRIWIFCVKKIR